MGTDCSAVCGELANPHYMPTSLCPGGRIYSRTNACPIAQHDLAVTARLLCREPTLLHQDTPLPLVLPAQDPSAQDLARSVCHWAYTAPGGQHLSSEFSYPAMPPMGAACATVCGALAHDRVSPDSFCVGGHIYNLAHGCPVAQHDFADTARELCRALGAMVPAQETLGQDPLQMPMLKVCAVVALAALVAFAVAFMLQFMRPRWSRHLLEPLQRGVA